MSFVPVQRNKLTNLRKAFRLAQTGINRAVVAGLKDAGELMIGRAIRILISEGHTAEGKLIKKFYVKQNIRDVSVTVGNRSQYAMVVEFGRRPNSKFPPPQAIRDWLVIKGMPAESSNVYLVSKKIARDGIPAVRYMSRAAAYVNPRVPEIINNKVLEFLRESDLIA